MRAEGVPRERQGKQIREGRRKGEEQEIGGGKFGEGYRALDMEVSRVIKTRRCVLASGSSYLLHF